MLKQTHILVIRLSAMGDVAMVVPVLRALTQQHPELKITVLTRSFFKPFFRDLESVEVFPADVKGIHKGVLGLYKLAKSLNKKKIHAVADLHHVLRSKVLKQFVDCKHFVSIDKGRKEKKQLTSGAVFKQLKTTHQRYVDVFEKLGYSIDLSASSYPQQVELNSKLQKIIGNHTTKCIGIAPFAAHEAKMYPLNLMQIVVKALSKNYKIILFGGGKYESDILNQWGKDSGTIINLAGKVSLNDELDVISNLDVMLSMDSGNAHIAAMLGVKVVTIWGVTHPFAGFAPFGQLKNEELIADRKKFPLVPTSIYGNRYPESYKNAAGSISPETVISKIKAII